MTTTLARWDEDILDRLCLKVLKHRRGYVIGCADEKGDLVCQATKYYTDRGKAEKDLKERTFKLRGYCSEGCGRCVYALRVGSWGVVDEDLPEGVKHYYFYIKAPEFTELGKLLKECEVVFDVYFNCLEGEFERIIVHDGFMNKLDYELNELEKDRVMGWVRTLEGVEIL